MIKRLVWIDKIEKAWEHRSIIWLAGVRRVGKTLLCQSLNNIEYYDCELPRVRFLFYLKMWKIFLIPVVISV